MISGNQPLSVQTLVSAGFIRSGSWKYDGSNLSFEIPIPKTPGVYAFAHDGIVQYVGVATRTLAQRLAFYAKPGPTQRTNIRLNAILKKRLETKAEIEIYTATPPDFEWMGLPVNGTVGLEFGLIAKYALPWNVKGIVK